MSTTDTTRAAIPVRIAQFPPASELPPKLRPPAAEYLAVYDRLDGLAKAWDALVTPEAIQAANEIDAGAQANAIRKGDTASSVGSPAADDLRQRTLNAERELVGAITATNIVADEVRAAAAAAWADPKTNGRDHAARAVQDYRDAIASLAAAQAAARAALTLPVFLNRLQGSGPLPTSIPWQQPNINPPKAGVWINPEDAVQISVVASLLDADADSFTDAIPLP